MASPSIPLLRPLASRDGSRRAQRPSRYLLTNQSANHRRVIPIQANHADLRHSCADHATMLLTGSLAIRLVTPCRAMCNKLAITTAAPLQPSV